MSFHRPCLRTTQSLRHAASWVKQEQRHRRSATRTLENILDLGLAVPGCCLSALLLDLFFPFPGLHEDRSVSCWGWNMPASTWCTWRANVFHCPSQVYECHMLSVPVPSCFSMMLTTYKRSQVQHGPSCLGKVVLWTSVQRLVLVLFASRCFSSDSSCFSEFILILSHIFRDRLQLSLWHVSISVFRASCSVSFVCCSQSHFFTCILAPMASCEAVNQSATGMSAHT